MQDIIKEYGPAIITIGAIFGVIAIVKLFTKQGGTLDTNLSQMLTDLNNQYKGTSGAGGGGFIFM